VLSLQFSFPTSLNTDQEARTSGSAHKLPRATRHHQEQPEGTINPNMPCAHLIALYLRAAEEVEAGCLAVRLVVRAGIEPCRLWHDSYGIAELRDALPDRQLRLCNFLQGK
jgi:hypothetical protein